MLRQYAAAALFGSFLKLSDDVHDIDTFKPYISETLNEFIKSFIFVLLTYISVNNINFVFIILIGHILLQIEDKKCLNNPYFFSGIMVSTLLCIFLFSYEDFSLPKIIINIFIIFIPAFIDHKLYPEDYSIQKIIGRIFEAFMALCMILFTYIFPNNFIIKEILYFGFFYMTTSVLTMSTQFTKEQLQKIDLHKYINLGKGLATLFYNETEKKINDYIDIVEKEINLEENKEEPFADVSSTLPPSPPANEDILHTV
jgi:hypothetical protein